MKTAKKLFSARKEPPESWTLCLYVLSQDPKCVRALENVQRICDGYIEGRYTLEVVDLAVNPQRARTDQIVALPTLVKKSPKPDKRIIGDFSNTDLVLAGLDLCHER